MTRVMSLTMYDEPSNLALGSADLHALQLGELDHRAGKVQSIPASVPERVKPDKQSIILHLPTCPILVGCDVTEEQIAVLPSVLACVNYACGEEEWPQEVG